MSLRRGYFRHVTKRSANCQKNVNICGRFGIESSTAAAEIASIQYASSQLRIDYLFALVDATTVLGFSFLFLVLLLKWYFLHCWHESARVPEAE
jgi:hypothetical protein